MSHYKPYPAYKDSGIEWIGEVPEHWKVVSLLHLFNIKAGGDLKKDFYSEEKTEEYSYPIYTNSIKSNEAYGFTSKPFFKANTITVTGRGEIGYAIYRDHEYDAIIRLLVLTPKNNKPCKYFAYCINSILVFFGGNTAVSQLSTEQISPYKIFCPPFPEQQSIVSFLDRQTAHIDALITKKTRFIELLKEKRQALITHAVTKGLDPNVKMKDSGVEWIGEVPEHWERRKLSHAFAKIGSGTTPPSDQPEWYSDDGIPWVTTGELRESEITKTTKCVTQRALDQFTTLRVYPKGSLAIAMYGATIGRLGILGVAATTNQACCVLSGGKSMTVRFVYYWLLVCKQPIIEIFAAGGGQPNINQEIISGLRVPSPSIDEQDAIAECLDREVAHLDLITEKTQRSIDLLRERRSALITAAVTGKIDLRGSL